MCNVAPPMGYVRGFARHGRDEEVVAGAQTTNAELDDLRLADAGPALQEDLPTALVVLEHDVRDGALLVRHDDFTRVEPVARLCWELPHERV